MAQKIFPVRQVTNVSLRYFKSLFGNSFFIKQKLHSTLSPVHEVMGLWVGQLLLGISLSLFLEEIKVLSSSKLEKFFTFSIMFAADRHVCTTARKKINTFLLT
jgi:hypothetical protein